MLVLTRKRGQHVLIGDRIAITVVRIDEVQVRLGITAPKHVPITRCNTLKPRLAGEVDQIGSPLDRA